MSTTTAPATVIENPAEKKFETVIDGHTAYVDYTVEGNTIAFEHTIVPEALQGRGLAGQLASACLASAREKGQSVTPVCQVFIGYMKKRPETHDLLSEAGKKAIA